MKIPLTQNPKHRVYFGENPLHHKAAWEHLIFGIYSIGEIIKAVDDTTWQKVKLSMRGLSLGEKRATLEKYVKENPSTQGGVPWAVKVRVTNYVNALKRGGLIR